MAEGRIDDLYIAIGTIQNDLGRLQTSAEENTRQHEQFFEKLDEINASTRCIPRLVERIAVIEPHIEEFKRIKQRGLGIMAAVAFIGGIGGAALSAGGAKMRAWFGW